MELSWPTLLLLLALLSVVAFWHSTLAAREAAARIFQIYGGLPSYRAMLDREGAEGPADVAIVGDAAPVSEQIGRLREIGVTDYLAIPFPNGKDGPASIERTREVIVKMIRN